MKLSNVLLFLALVIPSILVGQNNFSSSNFSKMSKEQKLKMLTSNPRIEEVDQLLEVLTLGIQDSNKDIQKEAMSKLAATMVGLQQFAQKRGSIPLSPARLAQVQSVLKAELANQDNQLRGGAYVALAYSGAPSPDVESALLNQFAQESDEMLKGGIIETMGFAGYDSDKYIQTLRESILDPSSYVRNAAAKTIFSLKSPGMLPLLAQALEKKLSIHWNTQAMAAYGAEAQPYLPLLERLLADPTIVGREEIANAIAAIKNPSPQAATTPQIKALSLINVSLPTALAATSNPSVATSTQIPTPSPPPTLEETKSSSNFPIILAAILAAVIAGIGLYILRCKST